MKVPFELMLKVDNTQFVVVENCTTLDTNAVILKVDNCHKCYDISCDCQWDYTEKIITRKNDELKFPTLSKEKLRILKTF